MTASPELFAFPNGKRFLDSVDRIPRGLECFSSMHGGHCNDNAYFPILQFALSVDQSDRFDWPAPSDLFLQFGNPAFSHPAVDLVLQTLHSLTVCLVSNGSNEEDSATSIIVHYRFEGLCWVNGFSSDSRFQFYGSRGILTSAIFLTMASIFSAQSRS